MIRGDVLFWPRFTFDDGAQAHKLLVIVGSLANETRLMLKTTSKEHPWRPDRDGCHHEKSVHRFKQYLAGFDKPTWIQFDPPIIRSISEITNANAKTKFALKASDLSAVTNCYKKSSEISEYLLSYLK